MGIENRDYIREDQRGSSFLAEAPSVKRIIIVTVIVFLVQLFWVDRSPRNSISDPEAFVATTSHSAVERWLNLDTEKVLQGQVWRLLTCSILHDRHSIWHILMNMLVLFWLGRSLEAHYGSREFMLFYLAAAIVASLSFVLIQLATGERVPAIGASGAVMAVFCLFALWNPGYTVNIYFFIPIPIIWLLGLYVIYDLHPLILQLSNPGWKTGVAHAAHLGGIAFGFLYYRNSWNLDRTVSRLVPASIQTKSKSNRGASMPPRIEQEQDRQDKMVDEILAKISLEGEANLTPREREILLEASKRYKDRRSV